MKFISTLAISGFLIFGCITASAFCSEIVCETAGRFQLSEGQNGYVDCVADDKGEVSVYKEVSCGEYQYLNRLSNCDFQNADMKEDFELIDKFDLERNDSYDSYCRNNEMPNICFSCNRIVHCIGEEAYVESCSEGETCAENDAFGGGVCLPYDYALTQSSNCECSSFGFAVDGFNENCFLFCDTSTQPPTIEFYECPDGRVFQDGKCKETITFGCYDPPPSPPTCEEMGTFLNTEECSYYYVCIPVGGSFETKIYCCEDPTQFYDVNTGTCENVCSILEGLDSPPFTCPGPGAFMNPYNCNIYYDCFFAGEDPVKQHTCPDGMYYHDDTHRCETGFPENCLESDVDYFSCPRLDEVVGIAGCSVTTTSAIDHFTI